MDVYDERGHGTLLAFANGIEGAERKDGAAERRARKSQFGVAQRVNQVSCSLRLGSGWVWSTRHVRKQRVMFVNTRPTTRISPCIQILLPIGFVLQPLYRHSPGTMGPSSLLIFGAALTLLCGVALGQAQGEHHFYRRYTVMFFNPNFEVVDNFPKGRITSRLKLTWNIAMLIRDGTIAGAAPLACASGEKS